MTPFPFAVTGLAPFPLVASRTTTPTVAPTIPTPNPMFEYGALIGQYYYNGGIVLGYAHGRQVFKKNLGTAFWADTKQYINDEFGDPDNGWGRREWIDFYIAASVAFRRGHITED